MWSSWLGKFSPRGKSIKMLGPALNRFRDGISILTESEFLIFFLNDEASINSLSARFMEVMQEVSLSTSYEG